MPIDVVPAEGLPVRRKSFNAMEIFLAIDRVTAISAPAHQAHSSNRNSHAVSGVSFIPRALSRIKGCRFENPKFGAV